MKTVVSEYRLVALLRHRSWLGDSERRDWFVACAWLVVWLYVAAVVIAILGQPLDEDDGIVLVGARLVQQGYKPHIDFWSVYPPVYYYLTAAGFRVFGATVLVYRWLCGVLYVLFLVSAGRFLAGEFPRFRRLIPCTAGLVAAAIGPNIGLQYWPAYATAWLALLVYLRGWSGPETRRGWMMVLSGLLAGATLLMRVNFGLYVPAVVGCHLALIRLFKIKEGQSPIRGRSVLAMGALFAVPALLSNAIFYAWVYGRNTGLALAQSFLAPQYIWAAGFFTTMQTSVGAVFPIVVPMLWFSIRLLTGSDRLAGKWLIPAGLGCATAGLAFMTRTQPVTAQYIPALEIGLIAGAYAAYRGVLGLGHSELCLLLFYACVLHYYVSDADAYHMAALFLAGAMLVPYLLFSRASTPAHQGSFIAEGSALVLIVAAAYGVFPIGFVHPLSHDFKTGIRLLTGGLPDRRVSDGERILYGAPEGAWASLVNRPQEMEALRFVRSKTTQQEPIFVGVADLSKARGNDVQAYWLADRPVGVRYLLLEGTTTEATAQTEMMADLERRKVQYVLIEHEGADALKGRHVGSRLLDNYIASHFREAARFGDFSVLARVVP